MTRPILLFTGPWADWPLDQLASRAADWGYQGLELCTWGDHLEVQRVPAEPDYCTAKLDLLNRNELQVPVIAAHRIGQATCDPIDRRHQRLLPDYVWGDGDPQGVQARAVEEMLAIVRAAEQLGVGVISGFTGSPIWSYIGGWPPPDPDTLAEAYAFFVRQWTPILDACAEAGIRFACEVHPGQLAFDIPSTEATLAALNHRPEFGLTIDPSHLFWQGIEPAEFVRQFADRIYHIHIKDAALTLTGRTSLLCDHLPRGDARRGWDFRSPGHGGIDWDLFIRAVNAIGYEGPLSVDWSDASMDREYGAEDACQFVQRLNFPGRTVNRAD